MCGLKRGGGKTKPSYDTYSYYRICTHDSHDGAPDLLHGGSIYQVVGVVSFQPHLNVVVELVKGVPIGIVIHSDLVVDSRVVVGCVADIIIDVAHDLCGSCVLS